jgi:acyl-CoA dehydrogenase
MNFDWTTTEESQRQKIVAALTSDDRAAFAASSKFEPAHAKELLLRYQERLAAAGYFENLCASKVDPGSDKSPDSGPEGDTLLAADGELVRLSPALYLSGAASLDFCVLASHFGTPDLARTIGDGLRRGRIVGAVALSSPEKERVQAQRHEQDTWRLSGVKSYVTNALLADWTAVFYAEGEQTSLAFVPCAGTPGVQVDALATMGLTGLGLGTVALRAVIVPGAQVVAGAAAQEAQSLFEQRRDLSIARAAVGLMHRITELAKRYAQEHERAGKPVVAHQEVRFRLADMLTLAQAAELACDRAAWTLATGGREARTLIACAKVFATEKAEQVSAAALHILAAHGYLAGSEIEQAYRDAPGMVLAGTTNEIARIAIADDLLNRI